MPSSLALRPKMRRFRRMMDASVHLNDERGMAMDHTFCLFAQTQRPEFWALALVCLLAIVMSLFHVKLGYVGFALMIFGAFIREPKDKGNAKAEGSQDDKGMRWRFQVAGPTSTYMIVLGGVIAICDIAVNRGPIMEDTAKAADAVYPPLGEFVKGADKGELRLDKRLNLEGADRPPNMGFKAPDLNKKTDAQTLVEMFNNKNFQESMRDLPKSDQQKIADILKGIPASPKEPAKEKNPQ